MGGGSAMDAGKIMWVLYENPDANFDDMAMDFMAEHSTYCIVEDIR